jgi:hypothetical protein
MPTSEKSLPRPRSTGRKYSYRRPLSLGELVPAIGVAIGAGFFAFYITRILLERTPLDVDPLGARDKFDRYPRNAQPRAMERLADE